MGDRQRGATTDARTRIEGLVADMLAGHRRALARLITYAEDGGQDVADILRLVHPHTGRAHVVGITGPPGAGKSTLVWALASEYRTRGQRVGVIAIDPSSPLSGGAVLGDRIRMPVGDKTSGIFFRSMASRGQLGGTSRAVRSVVHLLDAFGKDVIIIETVGAGQSDVAVRTLAHSTAVVSVPGLGDDIQMLKAGILEIADIYVVNKADRPDAARTVAELQAMLKVGFASAHSLGMTDQEQGWVPPIVSTIATKADGVDQLADALAEHRTYLTASGRWDALLFRQATAELQEALLTRLEQWLQSGAAKDRQQDRVQAIATRALDAFAAADQLLREYGLAGQSEPGDEDDDQGKDEAVADGG